MSKPSTFARPWSTMRRVSSASVERGQVQRPCSARLFSSMSTITKRSSGSGMRQRMRVSCTSRSISSTAPSCT
jgi:hypothetical protein